MLFNIFNILVAALLQLTSSLFLRISKKLQVSSCYFFESYENFKIYIHYLHNFLKRDYVYPAIMLLTLMIQIFIYCTFGCSYISSQNMFLVPILHVSFFIFLYCGVMFIILFPLLFCCATSYLLYILLKICYKVSTSITFICDFLLHDFKSSFFSILNKFEFNLFITDIIVNIKESIYRDLNRNKAIVTRFVRESKIGCMMVLLVSMMVMGVHYYIYVNYPTYLLASIIWSYFIFRLITIIGMFIFLFLFGTLSCIACVVDYLMTQFKTDLSTVYCKIRIVVSNINSAAKKYFEAKIPVIENKIIDFIRRDIEATETLNKFDKDPAVKVLSDLLMFMTFFSIFVINICFPEFGLLSIIFSYIIFKLCALSLILAIELLFFILRSGYMIMHYLKHDFYSDSCKFFTLFKQFLLKIWYSIINKIYSQLKSSDTFESNWLPFYNDRSRCADPNNIRLTLKLMIDWLYLLLLLILYYKEDWFFYFFFLLEDTYIYPVLLWVASFLIQLPYKIVFFTVSIYYYCIKSLAFLVNPSTYKQLQNTICRWLDNINIYLYNWIEWVDLHYHGNDSNFDRFQWFKDFMFISSILSFLANYLIFKNENLPYPWVMAFLATIFTSSIAAYLRFDNLFWSLYAFLLKLFAYVVVLPIQKFVNLLSYKCSNHLDLKSLYYIYKDYYSQSRQYRILKLYIRKLIKFIKKYW